MPPLSPTHESLGRAIRVLRARADLSQEALANAAGLDRTYVGAVERGERNVGYGALVRLASAFRIRTSELIAAAETDCEDLFPQSHARQT